MQSERLKILAIDDNRDNLTALKAVVMDAFPEATVLTALDGRRGIDLALAEDPDAILLDIVMPGMDGFEVCRGLKGDPRLSSIPVVFLTALKAGRDSRVTALECGAEGFLSKPIDELELTAQLRAMAKIKAANRRERQEKERLAALVAERTRELEAELAERQRAEEARERLQAQLVQAAKMESVGRLAGGVAHDFNNMLLVVLGHLEIALEQLDPSHPLHANLKAIQQATLHSADLTRQLLAFARKQTIDPKPLQLNDTLEGMVGMLRRLIGENIDLAWSPGAGLWPVKMDPSQVDQILTNLAVNARDAILGVGRVTIETGNCSLDQGFCAAHDGAVPGDYVMLVVGDDGRGMDREQLDRLFEPFFTTKGVGQGTGLGLATIYGIVKQNQGFIDVSSELGQGTTVKIYLPRHQGEVAPIWAAQPAPAPRGQGETVLLVEDEEMVLRLSRRILEGLGYRVLAAGTPGEGIRLAREHAGEISLLISDVVMPEMNGRDLVARIAAIRPGLKCLYMSGYTADVIQHQGVLDEGVQFIQKPFSAKDFADRVRETLG